MANLPFPWGLIAGQPVCSVLPGHPHISVVQLLAQITERKETEHREVMETAVSAEPDSEPLAAPVKLPSRGRDRS